MKNQEQESQLNTNLLPVIPLRGKVAFPRVSLAFEAGRKSTLKALERAGEQDKLVFVCAQKQAEKEEKKRAKLFAKTKR